MSFTRLVKFTLTALVLSASLIAPLAHAAVIELVTNGSLQGDIDNAGLPNGWLDGVSNASSPSTSDTMDETHNTGIAGFGFGATASPSPNGGTWVGIGRNFGVANESFYQVVSGFEAGKEYTISWYDANFGINHTYQSGTQVVYTGTNQVLATLTNGSSIFSFTGSSRALGEDWFLNSFTFTPTLDNYTLSFSLNSPTKSYLSIDGISITTEVAAIPEPSTWGFLILGFLMISFELRRRSLIKVN